jgi:hypothetical protein
MSGFRLAIVCIFAIAFGAACGQPPVGAPADATGICKDGTYSKEIGENTACAGHKGVQTWYGSGLAAANRAAANYPVDMPAPKPVAVIPSQPAPTPAASIPSMPATAAPAPAKGPAATAAAKTAAPGGAPNLVWLNTASNVYHCYGDTYYGKTKAGAYMTEADAKSKGAHGERGKTCSK